MLVLQNEIVNQIKLSFERENFKQFSISWCTPDLEGNKPVYPMVSGKEVIFLGLLRRWKL